MLLMTAFSTIVSGSAFAQMQDLTATVDPSQSSLNACLTAIDITDCQNGAINGSLEFGIDQSTGDVKIDNFSLTVGQIDWTLDAGFLGVELMQPCKMEQPPTMPAPHKPCLPLEGTSHFLWSPSI